MKKKNRFFTKRTERIAIIAACVLVAILILLLFLLGRKEKPAPPQPPVVTSSVAEPVITETPIPADEVTSETVSFDPTWTNGDKSEIHTGTATLYHAKPSVAKGKTVCINAGHGTSGGSEVMTLCHPDGTPKVTGGTTEAGATTAYAVSSGTELANGMSEADANLLVAKAAKERLLEDGYDVLMIRESEDVQLDNIARTLMANNRADCHIAIHYDSTDMDKGIFYMSVPSNETYRSMEPVASTWEKDNALGDAVTGALEAQGFKLFDADGHGALEMDLTQTSYSSVPSIDLEVGDTMSDHTDEDRAKLAAGISAGLDTFFGI